jgi:hypothetical protein
LSLRLLIRQERATLPPGPSRYPGFQPWLDPDGQEIGFSLETGSQLWMRLHKVGCFVQEAGRWEVEAFPDPGVGSDRLHEIFFHNVAPLVLQRHAWDCLHASAVLTPGGVVAFCGPSGRGKSTLARAWCERGAVPYGDDAVPFLARRGTVMAARIPQRLRLRGPAASRFREGGQANGKGHDPELASDMESTLRPLRCVYWLEPMSALAQHPTAAITPIPVIESFRLLLGEAHCVSLRDPACNRKMMHNYLSLVRLSRTFRLSFAAGLDLLPSLLDRLERHRHDSSRV